VGILDALSPTAGTKRPGTPGGRWSQAFAARAWDSSARFARVLVAFGAQAVADPAASLLYALDGLSRGSPWWRHRVPSAQNGCDESDPQPPAWGSAGGIARMGAVLLSLGARPGHELGKKTCTT